MQASNHHPVGPDRLEVRLAHADSALYVGARMFSADHVGLGDLFDSLTATGDNIFAVKTTLWTLR